MVRSYNRTSLHGKYGEETLKAALQSLECGKPLIRASKDFRIPARTLRRHRDASVKQPGTLRMGRFQNALPGVVEQELKSHITEMESKMFGLNIADVRKLTLDLAEKMKLQHPFNRNKQMADKDWVKIFMTWHGLGLRYPQGTSIARASGFNRGQVDNFFGQNQNLLEGHDIPPSRIWNMDEKGLLTVQTPKRVISVKGKRSVGKINSAERGTLISKLCACNAIGGFPSLPCIYSRGKG